MAEKTEYRYKIDPQDVDFTLRVRVPAIGNTIFNAAGIDAQTKGFGTDTLNENNYSWVLSRMALELDTRPQQYTPYSIWTWINEYSRVLSTRNFTLNDASGREFGRAVTQWCMIDLSARKAVDLTAVAGSHSSAMVDAPSPTDKPRKIAATEPKEFAQHKIVYSDIDFNRHVNTMRYIDMMFDMLPIESFSEEHKMRMDIHFLHESRYGQTLTVGYEPRENLHLFEITTDDGVVACRASIEFK